MKIIYKYFFIVLAFCLSMSVSSCSKDEDEVGTASDLIGIWEAVSDKGYEKENGVVTDSWDELEDPMRMEFRETGTYSIYFNYSGRWSEEEIGVWKKNGNKIYLTDSGNDETYSFTISQLTESTLTMFAQDSGESNGETYEWYEEISLRKVNQ